MSVLTEKDVKYEYRNSYQTVKAVGGVSCEFEQGKVYAIVGSSGSGKTTFLSLLAGLDKPTEGEIDFGGKSTSDIDRDSYRLDHVSVIYQNFNLFQHLTVLENTVYPFMCARCRRERRWLRQKKSCSASGYARISSAAVRICCPAESSSALRSRALWQRAVR